MLLDPPESLTAELIARYDALKKATANYATRPSLVNLTVKNAALTALNKTVDKCSVELGQPITPRPTIVPQDDSTLKLLYPAP